jgi:hypothetical protein
MLAAAGIGGARGLGAQPTPVARLEARLDARTFAAVERVLDSARVAGLPADPLVDRALEGASKRAPGQIIVAAVRSLFADLGRARAALGLGSSASELGAATDALRAGVQPDALRRLRRERPEESLTVPLGVLSDIVSSGVPVDVATKTVLDLTRAGAADELLMAFRRDVERDIGVGAPPVTAATLRQLNAQTLLSTDGSAGAGPPRVLAPKRQRP